MPYPVERCEDKKDKEVKCDLWDSIQNAIHEKYMITCASGEGDVAESDEIIDKLGLARNHCFSITGQYLLLHSGKEEKLLKISNPWNKQEWKGKWSDKDDSWTKTNKLKVKFENKSPGEFFISYKDYLKYFDSTTICKLDPFYDQ